MSNFAEMLAAMRAESAPEPEVLPEDAIARLREAHERMTASNPWKAGDIVRPRKDAPIQGTDRPHLVIEASDVDLLVNRSSRGDSGWNEATALNTRVLCLVGGHIAPFLVPHWMMEPWSE